MSLFRQYANGSGATIENDENDDFEDFQDFSQNVLRASNAASTVALLGAQRIRTARANKRSPGPAKSTLKVKVYYLPDASPLPKFTGNPIDNLIIRHTTSGYGKTFSSDKCFIIKWSYITFIGSSRKFGLVRFWVIFWCLAHIKELFELDQVLFTELKKLSPSLGSSVRSKFQKYRGFHTIQIANSEKCT